MNNIAYKKVNSDLKFVYSENDTISIIFQSNDILLGVVGEFNNNIKELEKITKTKIHSRGNSILVKSTPEKNELVKNAIKFLSEQLKINGEKKDIISSVNKFMINEKLNNTNKNIEYIIKTPKKSVIPRSERQKKYVTALRNSEIIISAGPAGTGKTFLAVAVGEEFAHYGLTVVVGQKLHLTLRLVAIDDSSRYAIGLARLVKPQLASLLVLFTSSLWLICAYFTGLMPSSFCGYSNMARL